MAGSEEMLVPGADWGNNSGWEYNVSLGQSPHSLHSTPNNNSHAVRGFFFLCCPFFHQTPGAPDGQFRPGWFFGQWTCSAHVMVSQYVNNIWFLESNIFKFEDDKIMTLCSLALDVIGLFYKTITCVYILKQLIILLHDLCDLKFMLKISQNVCWFCNYCCCNVIYVSRKPVHLHTS